MNDTLFIITARGGSKGIPGKNIKPLNGKPLLYYSIDIARHFVKDENICLSTDSHEIIKVANEYNLNVPFIRPLELSGDQAGTYEVLLHALNYYESKGIRFSKIVLLQPTSPFRKTKDVEECIALLQNNVEMVVSVKKPKSNPLAVLFKVEKDKISKLLDNESGLRRQDAVAVVELNGAVYVYDVNALKNTNPSDFKNLAYYVMDEISSVDIDEPFDWQLAEFMLEKKIVQF
ncbi:MAG: acylneuraminate cytidylyltransferase family protein [Sphingobacteriaceae bacterium]|nr:acylneuraminate cytidylyltransferase family protein [Sphingobacteriaceae bacterium]